jgi:hypothetical protein
MIANEDSRAFFRLKAGVWEVETEVDAMEQCFYCGALLLLWDLAFAIEWTGVKDVRK